MDDWWDSAACAQVDPDLFFPAHASSGVNRLAKRICAGCPVRGECAEYAVKHDEGFGVWGGMTERERRRLKRAS
jgi:WhiB family transcriptional regulator, redox-sensing transcriptional regulator